jgi:hypothetical protein
MGMLSKFNSSVEITERYLGSRQRIVNAVDDKLGITPDGASG